jgi:hypothetical protein
MYFSRKNYTFKYFYAELICFVKKTEIKTDIGKIIQNVLVAFSDRGG